MFPKLLPSLEETIKDYYENCSGLGQSEDAVPYLLFALIIARRPKVIFEIGAYKGFSSFAMASALKFNAEFEPLDFLKEGKSRVHPIKKFEKVKGKIFCIDPILDFHFKRRLDKFLELKEYIYFVQKKSGEVDLDKFDQIDFLFIDGHHSYKACQEDFLKFYPKISLGGLVVIHDYFPDAPVSDEPWWGPNLFSKQLREAFNFSDSIIIDTGFGSLAIFRKKIDYIDYPFLSTNYIKGFFQFLFHSPGRKIRWLGKKLLKIMRLDRNKT